MIDKERKRRWTIGEENFYAPGITDAQVANLELRGRAERCVRQAMRMNGASPAEIEAFISASLPPIRDVVAPKR